LRHAVTTHVQSAFNKEAEVCASIDAGSITTYEQVASAFNIQPPSA
jgi:hypothetical protein